MLPPRIRRRVMQNGSEPMLTKPSGSGMCLVSCGNKFRLTKSIRRCFSSWKDALDLYMRQRLLGRLQALRSCLQEHLGMEMKQLDLPSDDDKNIVRISSQSSMQACEVLKEDVECIMHTDNQALKFLMNKVGGGKVRFGVPTWT
ncbi:unnamed protein product [Effrenium voratum]|nr:unnamed protein product [Effrenium voratum]